MDSNSTSYPFLVFLFYRPTTHAGPAPSCHASCPSFLSFLTLPFLLANVSKEIRPLLVAYDPDGPWIGLVQHLLQTCGPPDILSAVYAMLEEARSEHPPRTLRVRVQTLVFSWKTAHHKYFNCNPLIDDRDVRRPPSHCPPSIHPFQQQEALKELIMRCDVGLWNSFCGQALQKHSRKNPVLLLQFILELDTGNLQMIVKPPSHPTANYVNIRTGPSRRADPYPTLGAEGHEEVTIPMADVRALEARAATSDTVIEANRIAYEQSRVGGVTGSFYKWCAAAGITDEELQDRHNNHKCYFCGEFVRNGGVIVHTFWHCPERLKVHDEIQARINETSRGPTQRESNDRRHLSKGSAREDADQDQTFPRRTPRDQSGGRWGGDPLPANFGQKKGYDGRNSPRQLTQTEPNAATRPRRSDTRAPDPQQPRGGSRERVHPTGRTEPGASTDFAENRTRMVTGAVPEGAALVQARATKRPPRSEPRPTFNTTSPPEEIPDTREYSSGSESEPEDGGRQPVGKTPPPGNDY